VKRGALTPASSSGKRLAVAAHFASRPGFHLSIFGRFDVTVRAGFGTVTPGGNADTLMSF